MNTKQCLICSKTIIKTTKNGREEWRNKKYCSRLCKDKGVTLFQRGENNGRYKGGCVSISGYLCIGRHYKHRMVMEEFLKRKLNSTEIVHHKNGNKLDNRLDNLEIMSRSKHSKLHFGNGNFGIHKIRH